jgi:hypothetical protein
MNWRVTFESITGGFSELSPSDKVTLFIGVGSIAIGVISAVAGAWFGSYSASKLARSQQRRDVQDKRYSALIAAQYALMSQWNILEGVRVKHLEPRRSDKMRFLKMPVIYVPEMSFRVPLADITFVAESRSPNLLQEIHIAENFYLTCMESVTILRKEVEAFLCNPKIVRGEFDFETGVAPIEANPREVFMLKEATDNLYVIVDMSLRAIRETIPKLARYIEQEFKRRALGSTPIAPADIGKVSSPA